MMSNGDGFDGFFDQGNSIIWIVAIAFILLAFGNGGDDYYYC